MYTEKKFISGIGRLFFAPLKKYQDGDYVVRKKARFLYVCILCQIFFAMLVFLHTVFWFHYQTRFHLVAFLLMEVLAVGALLLLIGGRFTLAGNASVLVALAYVWTVMFTEQSGSIVARVDSVVHIVAILATLPLIMNQLPMIIFHYLSTLAVVWLFSYIQYTQDYFSGEQMVEYALDNTVAILLCFAVSCLLFSIYRSALHQAQWEIKEKRTLHQQLEWKTRRELDQARQIAEQSSYMADKAEITTGVLHNIGNLLNNVGFSTALLKQYVQNCRTDKVILLNQLLQQHKENLPEFMESEKGRHLLPYLDLLAAELEAEKQRVAGKLNTLNESVDHMGEVIRLQQALGKAESLVELGSLGVVVKEALLIEQNTLESRRVRVNFRELALNEFFFDRYKVLQILLNLIRNAINSIAENRCSSGEINIRIRRVVAETPRVAIDVMDNGGGIAQKNLSKIFSYGFTTSKHGHGFGLHYSARSADEMGGNLSFRNNPDGPGATFTLELPFARELQRTRS